MEKDFLKLRDDPKRMRRIILTAGLFLSLVLGVKAYKETELPDGNVLYKNSAEKGAYEQDVIAYVGDEKIPLTVTVEERILSKEEAQEELSKAENILPDILKGENESLLQVTKGLEFADRIPESSVEIEWAERQLDYFYYDGRLRENLELTEPVELTICAVLICQEYTKDYETTVIVFPKEQETKQKLLNLIYAENEENHRKDAVTLPAQYEGENVIWRRPMDDTFLYFLALTAGAFILLKVGEQRDKKEALKERLEELEKDYAQIVGKFAMLLSAGLSVRNAWERIVRIQKRKGALERAVYQEMNWAFQQMQKGVSETEVYEKFGMRVQEVHYKKLMALFISDKRRGSIPLLDAMNQEMLLAWEEQKRKTRQQGEKIGTKLLLPMMGMLGVVFLMILVPAFLSFQL